MIQQLLNKEIQDQKWNNWIKDDFPSQIIKHFDQKFSRTVVKEQFMIAISKKCDFGFAADIRGLLEQDFPMIEPVRKIACRFLRIV